MQEEVKHYKVKSLPTILRPNSVYYVKATSQSAVKTYITDQGGIPFPLIDLASLNITSIVNSVTGTGVTGSSNNPVVNISTFKSSQLGNLIELSSSDGKLFVKPITSPDESIDITSTATSLELQLGASLQTQIQNALQPGDNISELVNDVGYITLADLPFSAVSATAWTPNHTVATGNPYLAGTIVYYQGHIFQANFNNDSIVPVIGGNLYWTDLGVGYLINQEQTDWLAVSGSAFIKNKPTNVSSFVNDAGYLTSFTEVDPVFSSWLSTNPLSGYATQSWVNSNYYPLSSNPANYITSSALSPYLLSTVAASTYLPIPSGTVSQYIRGDGSLANFPTIPAGGLPPGGTAGQILTKVDAIDYNATWQDNYADWTSVVKHIVKNDGTSLIIKGTPVYSTGADGTNILVGKASNTSEATSSKTMGLMQSDITTTGGTQIGFVITEGLLGGLNTAGATAGDPVWLGAGGTLLYGLINKPYAPNHLVFIGIVTKVSAGNGEIFVKIQNGFELDELHNVRISGETNNNVLTYNGSTQVWENKSVVDALGYEPMNDLQIRRKGITIYDDLFGTGASDYFQKLTFNSGSWASSTIFSENNPGVIAISSSSGSTNGGGNIVPGSTAAPRSQAVGVGMQFDLVMRTSALGSNIIMRFGIIAGTVNPTQPTDGIYFVLNNNTLIGQTAVGNVRSSTPSYTGITGGVWYHFRVTMTTASLATYELYDMDGTLLWTDTLTTNLPTIGTGIQPTFIAYNTLAETRQICQVDYISYTYPPMNRGALK